MTTFSFKPGAAEPLAFQPVQDDGTVPDLTGVAMQLRIQAGAACIALDGVLDADAQLFAVDLNGLMLPPWLYRATSYYDFGDGWRRGIDVNLSILGGC